jgi:Spy/CpxP family protein refolding chaperone
MSEESPKAEIPEIPVPPRSPAWKLALLGVAILVCGAVIGACLVILLGPTPRPPGQGQLAPQVRKRIARVLNLAPEQSAKITQIVQEHTTKIREIQTEAHGEMREEMEAMHAEVLEQLNDQQKRTYQREIQNWRRLAPRGPQQPGRRGPLPGGPGGRPEVPPQARPGQLFDRFDANKDGKLTKDELPPRLAEPLMRADEDGDGALTREELARSRPRLRPGGPGGQPDLPPPPGAPGPPPE